jgi:hypothetical protein
LYGAERRRFAGTFETRSASMITRCALIPNSAAPRLFAESAKSYSTDEFGNPDDAGPVPRSSGCARALVGEFIAEPDGFEGGIGVIGATLPELAVAFISGVEFAADG